MLTDKAAARNTTSKSSSKGSSSKPVDAIAMLTADHQEVKAMFKAYEKLCDDDGDADEKQVLAQKICDALTVHATVEEEIFYPAAREVLGDDEDLVDEADVEHASARDLIAQIEDSDPDEELFDAKVKVLGEYIEHHVKEEEGEMFPKVKKARLDTVALGAEMADRKKMLMDAPDMDD